MDQRFEKGDPVREYWLAHGEGFVVERRGRVVGRVVDTVVDPEEGRIVSLVVHGRVLGAVPGPTTEVPADQVAAAVPAREAFVLDGAPPDRSRRRRSMGAAFAGTRRRAAGARASAAGVSRRAGPAATRAGAELRRAGAIVRATAVAVAAWLAGVTVWAISALRAQAAHAGRALRESRRSRIALRGEGDPQRRRRRSGHDGRRHRPDLRRGRLRNGRPRGRG